MNKLIKQDINFMEYPLYVLNEKTSKKDLEVCIDDKKYRLNVGYKTPNSTDMLFLYYFIKISQEGNYKRKLVLKKSQIVKDITENRASYYYRRLKETLEVWRNTGLTFEGTFYDGENYQTLVFGVLDHGELKEDGTVLVTFNETFLKILEETNFYRYINFNEFKKLRKPISRRLYELLKKSKFPFKIDIKKLAQKLTLDRKYPSSIIIKLEPAIKEINKNTDLNILFSYYKNDSGRTICEFKQLTEENISPNQLQTYLIQLPDVVKDALSTKYQIPSIYNIIKPYCKEPIDTDFLISNIKYSLKNHKSNFPHYLTKSLENDYAVVEREKTQKQEKIKRDRELLRLKKEREEQERQKLGESLYNTLTEEEEKIYSEKIFLQLKSDGIPPQFINKDLLKFKVIEKLLHDKESQQAGTQEDLF